MLRSPQALLHLTFWLLYFLFQPSNFSIRRYNGSLNEPDTVKAYCVGLRDITDTSTDNAPVAGSAVSINGAMALTAGAIAFGAAVFAM